MPETSGSTPVRLLRPMQYADLETVVQIECAAHITPWSAATLRECLRVGYDCELLLEQGAGVGFSIARTGPDDTELLNLCVHPDHQGGGRGQRLLDAVVARARRHGVERVLLDVREGNSAARALYAKNGFRAIGLRPGYYALAAGGREHAVVMALDLAG
ncbi:MAG: ribosomal protein S18-alanine N-acetyltransferase [Pseudomonadota bacterium]